MIVQEHVNFVELPLCRPGSKLHRQGGRPGRGWNRARASAAAAFSHCPTVGVGFALVVAIAVIVVGVFAVAPALRARLQESALPVTAETTG